MRRDPWRRIEPRYRFSTFVKGPTSSAALAIARRIAKGSPRAPKEPVLLWGDSGLGKTHLLHAIANSIIESSPETQVRLILGEQWNRCYNASALKRGLDAADLVLVESAHFFTPGYSRSANRPARRFISTVESLFKNGKRLVFEADRSLAELRALGLHLPATTLAYEVGVPDLATRSHILKSKARQHQFDVPDDVIALVANNITNVRELEGALHRLRIPAARNRGALTVARSRAILRDLLAAYATLVPGTQARLAWSHGATHN